MTTPPRRCVDCPSPAPGRRPRPAPHPGPRCATHHREAIKARKQRRHEQHVVRTYRGVAPGDYERIVQAQAEIFGGPPDRCPICRWAKIAGSRRMAALEHDHRLNWPRGAVCAFDNEVIGRWRDDPAVPLRLAQYLLHPPAWTVIGPPPEQAEAPF